MSARPSRGRLVKMRSSAGLSRYDAAAARRPSHPAVIARQVNPTRVSESIAIGSTGSLTLSSNTLCTMYAVAAAMPKARAAIAKRALTSSDVGLFLVVIRIGGWCRR